jgi:signal transduction histidine kinase
VATVLQAPPLLFSESAALTCARCPRNLALIESAPTVAGALFTLQLVCATGVVVSGCAVLLRRWQHSSPPQRRAMSPVVWSAGGAGLLAALSFVAALADEDAASAGIDWAYVTLFASIPFAFLVGLLRSRLFRAQALSELVRRLGDRPRPGRLRDVLAHALGDRALAIAYWLPAQACYVDARARPVELRAAGSGRAATSIELDGRRVAAIVHDASLCEDPQLVSAAAAAAALELDRERLDAELRARVEELRASRARVVEAADRERHRIERNLHDGAQERLVSLLLNLKLARRGADSHTDGPVRDEEFLDQVERDLTAAVAELRALASGILPPVLRDRGLAAALDELSRRFPLPVSVEDVPAGRLPERVELAVYFVVSEALTNAAKHARASRARVRVARVDGRVLFEVADDGVGGAKAAEGSGLQGLADRVGALDGHIELDSPAGRGTTVRAEIPCAS